MIPARYLVTAWILVATLAAAWVADRSIPTLGLALCADACGGRTEYYFHGECECEDSQHAPYGRTE